MDPDKCSEDCLIQMDPDECSEDCLIQMDPDECSEDCLIQMDPDECSEEFFDPEMFIRVLTPSHPRRRFFDPDGSR